ncbi:hypothetical protein K1T71_014296 [Dendrolimus kikuchii]|uniref:Uncharacterized protein n=1 Tax=Dendrolimus kikuchii TaxID=765133 RepID=A0ACC1CFR3_9NEOP|nr:hypothetical protein K1T71_014296 [Dendrolimus kikuchii]
MDFDNKLLKIFYQNRKFNLVYRFLFHLLNCVIFYIILAVGHIIIVNLTEQQIKEPIIYLTIYKYPHCLLTNWNVMFQTIFISLSLLYDVLEWLDKNDTNFGRKLKFIRDVLFCSWVLPLTLFISSMFWTIFWIDRELVFPTVYDEVVPWWFNHCVHTNIVVVIVVETLLQPRRYPTHFKLELIGNGFITFLYAVVYYTVYFVTNRWLYGVFGVMTWWQVCLFQILIWISCFIFYFIQFPINRLFHKESLEFENKEKIRTYQVADRNGKTNDWNLNFRNGKHVENSAL